MEAIKQEIISCIYENGENLITGPVLQEVLLDMVDDTNAKIASGSVPGDLVNKTGSWDDAADWVEQNSSSVVLQPELEGYTTEQWVEDQGYLKEVPEGYATEQWVEGQGYLKEVPEGYATTESLNDLSESISQSIADIPAPDLSNYVTKPELNEATESVKEWVENKHYLTSASLSGSVTEETVGFMINDATASVKNWVESQSYATETFVSQAIAEIPGTDLTGYATEQWVEEQGYLKEHQDISGLATTESVSQLSESIAQTIEDLPQVDLSGYVTTASYSADSASFDERINAITGSDLSGYATTASVNSISQSISQSIDALAGNLNDKAEARDLTSLSESISSDLESKADDRKVNNLSESVAQDFANLDIPDVSGLATTSSVNQLSESVAQTIENLPQADLSGYLQTSSYLVDSASFDSRIKDAREEATTAITNVSEGVVALSASFDSRINDITGSDLSGYATTESVNQLSSSVATDIQNARTEASQAITGLGTIVQGESDRVTGLSASFDDRINNITGSSVDLSGYATTQSVNNISASFAETIDNIPGTDLTGYATEQWVENQGYLTEHQDISGLATTSSLNSVSQSLSASIAAIPSSPVDLSGYATTESVNQLSESVAEDFANLDIPDVSGYATTQSVNALSASFDQRINNITGSGGSGVDTDLRNFLFGVESQTLTGITGSVTNIYSDVSSDTTLGFNAVPDNGKSLGITIHNVGNGGVAVTLPDSIVVDGTTYNLINNGIDNSGSMSIPASEYGDIVITRNGTDLFVRTSIDVSNISGSSTPVDLSGYATTESVNTAVGQVDSRVTNLSASFDQRINDIPGSDVDLSGYATTESVNTLSASFAETIDNIPGSGASGDYLPLAGGTLTGNLFVGGDNSIGVGSTKVGDSSLTIGNSDTSTQGAHYGLAVGENCSTDVYGGVALGRETSVEGNAAFGVATGFRTRVEAMAGYAGGCRSTASANFAFAAGFGAEAASLGQVVLGSYNVVDRSSGTGSYAVILANGKSSTWNQDDPGDVVRSNGLAIKWDGGIDINYSGSTITLQDKIAELEAGPGDGYVTTESLNEALSKVGVWERGEGSGSAVLSGSLGRATGIGSVVMGTNVASGHASVAEGQYTTASGEFAHAEGHLSQANGNGSHAEGTSYTAGTASYAHAENRGYALGAYSHAEGDSTKALKAGSHVEGFHTVADNEYEHASGRFNFTSSNQIFSVGIGQSEGARKNAISIITGSGETPSASVFIYGIGGYDGRNPEPGTNDLATVLNSITSSGSPVDLSEYATTESVNTAVGQVDNRVTNLSASFDQRIDEIVAASGGVDPSNFAKAPSIIYQTDGSTGLAGVNITSSTAYVISDEAWQLENLDLSVFDRIDCYFKHSSPRIVTVVLDDITLDSTFGAYVEKASVMTLNVKPSSGDTVKRTDLTRKWVAVDSTKTKLQVAVNTDSSDLLYKIVGYPKIQ